MDKKGWAIFFVAVLALMALSVWQYRSALGKEIWSRARVPAIAVFLFPDAQFAVTIGNYYFNVEKSGVYDLSRAEKYFNYALRLNPLVSDVWHQLARIDFLRGDFDGATAKINKQIELHGDSLMASYYVRGLIFGYQGSFDRAEKDFKKFLEWDPRNWAVYNDLAWIYFQKGDFQKAEESAGKGLELDRRNPWLLTAFGVALFNQGQKAEAKEVLLYARIWAEELTEKDWMRAYPGNNPKKAKAGLEAIKKTIDYNLGLVR